MTKEAVRNITEAREFRPFTVRLTDGKTYRVPARDWAHVSPGGGTLTIYTGKGEGIVLLDIRLITAITPK